MRSRQALSAERWHLTGWRQNDWELARTVESSKVRVPDVGPIPARVPGSVRGALVEHGIVPDPMSGVASRDSEWIENRHWEFSTTLDDLAYALDEASLGQSLVLVCEGLDYAGCVLLGSVEVGRFKGAFVEHEFDLSDAYLAGHRRLRILFSEVPDGLGQTGWTSRIREWKPRFNYGWDWTPRIVQIGISDGLYLERRCGARLASVRVDGDYDRDRGQCVLAVSARLQGLAGYPHTFEVSVDGPGYDNETIKCIGGQDVEASIVLANASPWQAATGVNQAVYQCSIRLLGPDGSLEDELTRQVGFRRIEWAPSHNAPSGAEPWLCEVNGHPVFLAGVNWVPIRPDFADVSADDYRIRLETYRELGFALLRVWGGAGLEREVFYALCDQLGLLVWQELPLSSSGLDNEPPRDEAFAEELATIARSYIQRRSHHACLALWGGGNELTRVTAPAVPGTPLSTEHPALAAAANVVSTLDPNRRFVATSPSGPRFSADATEYGLGVHHDVHGPWEFDGTFDEWAAYWDSDDSILRSEVGMAGASPLDLLERFGLLASNDFGELRQLWTHSSGWWLAEVDKWQGRSDLASWVAESQERQATFLSYAAKRTRDRFPQSTGFIVWFGHDTFPCAVSLSILDFEGRPKPAAQALRRVFASAERGDE